MDHKNIMQGLMVRIAVSVFGLATLAMLLLALYNDKGYFAVHAQALKLKSLQNDIQATEAEINKTREENKQLETRGSDAIEDRARELNLIRPSEVIINISEDPAPAPVPADNE